MGVASSIRQEMTAQWNDFATLGHFRVWLKTTCASHTVAKLVVQRIHPVVWLVTRSRRSLALAPYPDAIEIPCLTTSVADGMIRHVGHPLDLPWRVQRLAMVLATRSDQCWTRETVNRLAPRSEQWSSRGWRQAIGQIRGMLPDHLDSADGRGLWFHPCGLLVPFSNPLIPEPPPFCHTLGWAKGRNEFAWRAVNSVHQVLDIVDEPGAIVFNLTAWEVERQWFEAILEVLWSSHAQIWLWDHDGYPLVRDREGLAPGDVPTGKATASDQT
jgi:hypothetical protein